MTRLLSLLLVAVLSAAATHLIDRSTVIAAGSPPSPAVAVAQQVEPQQVRDASRPPAPRREGSPLRHRCTTANWRTLLHPAERWIDWRESRLNPSAVEPSTGAFGLGQLLAGTYRNLGLPMSGDPCAQIKAQRAYMRERYGNWRNAKTHWQLNGWW